MAAVGSEGRATGWSGGSGAIKRATQYRIDDRSANPLRLYHAMGSPADPTPDQRRLLMAASEVTPVRAFVVTFISSCFRYNTAILHRVQLVCDLHLLKQR